MKTWADIPGIRVGRLSESTTNASNLTITIEEPDLPSRLDEAALREVDAAWESLRLANPRLFDGPMLSVLDYDAAAGRITCARASYRFVATAAAAPTGARMLAVNGVLTGEDARGERWALLAKRGAGTRVYPGLWEFAPAGGVDHALSAAGVPRSADGATRFGIQAVLRALRQESEEELALSLAGLATRAVALCEDAHAPSVDVIVRVELGRIDPQRPPRREACWEYSQTRWVRVEKLRGVEDMSPMARGVARFLGWG